VLEHPLDHRSSRDGQHLLRRAQRERPEPGAEAADEDDRSHGAAVVVVAGAVVLVVDSEPVAVVPKDKDIPQPPSAPKLPELGTVDGGDAITVPSAAGSVEGTVAPGTDAPAPTDVSTSTPATSAATTTSTG